MHKNSKVSTKKYKSTSLQYTIDTETQGLSDILAMLEWLYEMRFIEKISRPIDLKTKQKLAQKYADKVTQMNIKLRKVLKDLSEKANYEDNIKDKVMRQEVALKKRQLRKKVKIIQGKHNDLFVAGSFKHYKKIKVMYGLRTSIEVINIEDWANVCIGKIGGQGEGCC